MKFRNLKKKKYFQIYFDYFKDNFGEDHFNVLIERAGNRLVAKEDIDIETEPFVYYKLFFYTISYKLLNKIMKNYRGIILS